MVEPVSVIVWSTCRGTHEDGRRILIEVGCSHGVAPLHLGPAPGRAQRANGLPRSDGTVHQRSRGIIPRPSHRATSPSPPARANAYASCPSGVFAHDAAATSAAHSRFAM